MAEHAVAIDATHAVRSVLAGIGRTEDLRFSPSGTRLAVARFASNRITLVDVKVAAGDPPAVLLDDVVDMGSEELSSPHGLDFLDEDTLVVANRTGGVAVLRVEPRDGEPALVNALAGGGVYRGLRSPGSIAVVRPGGEPRLIVCDNEGHVVTGHTLERGADGVAIGAPEVLVSRTLDIPDGVALSRDGRWLAVSNHHTNSVMIYAVDALGPEAQPSSVLRGVRYPHGLRFVDGGRALVVADAGSPHLLAFHRDGDSWHGVRYPTVALPVIDRDAFEAGQHNPEEGGPKGIDVDADETVVAVTSETLPLAFFPLAPLIAPGPRPGVDDLHLDYEMHVAERNRRIKRERSEAIERAGQAEHRVGLGQIEISDLRGRLVAAEAAADSNQRWAEAERARAQAAEAHLAALRSTKLFRVSAPLRRLYAWARGR